MKYLLPLLLLTSCMQSNHPEQAPLEGRAKSVGHTNVDQALINVMEYEMTYHEKYPINARSYFLSRHTSEVLKNLSIAEKIEVQGINSTLVFYTTSIGSEVIRKADWFRKVDGKYFIDHTYYSPLDDDPFRDGKPAEAKQLLDKKSQWEKSNSTIWWN